MPTTKEQKVSLEQALMESWMEWKKNPSRENGGKLLRIARPLIEQIISSYLGIQHAQDPLLVGRAQLVLLRALENYDPTKGPITAYAWTHLQRIQRIFGRQQSVLSVPEQIILDSKRLENAEKELEEKLGRKPSTVELADYTKLSVKRIEKIRKQSSVGYESSFEAGADESTGGWLPGTGKQIDPELQRKLLEVFYESVGNERDRAILEQAYGLKGQKPKRLIEIAADMHVSPSAVSKTLNQLNSKFNEFVESWMKTNSNVGSLDID